MKRAEFESMLLAALPEIEGAARYSACWFGIAGEWQDIAQDSLLRMLEAWEVYDQIRGSLGAWSWRIVRNVAATRRAELSARICVPLGDEFAASHCDIESDLHASFILANLNPETRLYCDGYNLSEIASIVGLGGRSGAKWRIDTCAARIARLIGYREPMGRRTRRVKKCLKVSA